MLQFDQPNSTLITDQPSLQTSKPSTKTRSTGRWTKEEHQKFVEGLEKFGKNWKLVEEHVGTRNGAQIRSHAQKFFNRLEREFNVKFENLSIQSEKDKFSNTLKMMGTPSPNHSNAIQEIPQEETKQIEKASKEVNPIQEVPCRFDTLVHNSMRSNAFSLANSPKLDHFEYPPTLVKRASRKMSEDILSIKSSSMFDILLAKMKMNNLLSSPKLSDMVEMSSSTRSSFDAPNFKLQSFQPVIRKTHLSAFRPAFRKISEDNVLVHPSGDLSEFEYFGKRVKQI